MADADPDPPPDGRHWSARDEAIAMALARGQSRQSSAKSCNVSVRTVHGRLRDPAFVALVASFRAALVSEAVARITGLAGKAADELEKLLDDPAASIRLRTAQTIFDSMVKLR